MGAISNRLFRVKGTLAGHEISCLIDCGASHDFVSQSFVDKNKLTEQLLPTTRRVRGYDGQVNRAGGTLVVPLTLNCPAMPEGVLVDTTPRRAFVVAQLHSDDVILGMPWLAELDVKIDFNQQRVCIPLASKALVELPLLPRGIPLPTGAHSELISSIMQLYADPLPSKQVQREERDALHEMLSRTHARDTIADLAMAHDDRGRTTSAAQTHAVQEPTEAPELVRMREKLLKEFSDVFPDSLPTGLPLGRGHELHIQLTPGAKPPARGPPRINQKHATFESKWLEDMQAKKLISGSQSQFAAPHFYVEKPETPVTGGVSRSHRLSSTQRRDSQKQVPAATRRSAIRQAVKGEVLYQDRLAHGLLSDSHQRSRSTQDSLHHVAGAVRVQRAADGSVQLTGHLYAVDERHVR